MFEKFVFQESQIKKFFESARRDLDIAVKNEEADEYQEWVAQIFAAGFRRFGEIK